MIYNFLIAGLVWALVSSIGGCLVAAQLPRESRSKQLKVEANIPSGSFETAVTADLRLLALRVIETWS